MVDVSIAKDTARLTQELERIESSLKNGVETTLKDIRWTQYYIAKAVLSLVDCVKPAPVPERPRWQVTAMDTAVKWGTMAIIGMVVYVFLQVVNSGFRLPLG